MDKEHHPKDNVHRLHIKRKEERRGVINIEECVEYEIVRLYHYVKNSQQRHISVA